jgi:hypothetical protein
LGDTETLGIRADQTAEAPAGTAVIALIVKEFSRQAVTEQARLKSQLEALVAIAIQPLAPADRIVLETPDGLVVVVLGDPGDALDVAERAQAGAADLPLAVAVNHGPVKSITDTSGGARFVGDGLVSALTLANLATRGRLLVSRAFRDSLANVAPHRARKLHSVGALTDANLRTHELFTPDPAAAMVERQRLMIAGGLAVFGILGAGVAIRAMRSGGQASIQFDISPQGDIFVNGELKGTSPPLTRVALRPGVHAIEVRNSGHAPLRLELNLKPAEEAKVTHAFGARRAARKEGDSLVEELWRRMNR